MIARRRDRALAVVVAAAARAGKELFQVTKPIPAAPAGETTAALRERQQALLEQIETAREALAAANSEEEAATTAFDPKSKEFGENAKRLWLAQQCVLAHKRQLGELTAQREAIIGAIEVAKRAQLERGRDDLKVRLSRPAVERHSQALVDREAQLCLQLIEVRVERATLASEYAAMHRELLRTLQELGELHAAGATKPTPDGRGVISLTNPEDHSSAVTETRRVALALERLTNFSHEDTPRAELLRGLVRQLQAVQA